MIQTFIFSIVGWVQSIGWIGVFFGSVLEEVIAPIPSTLTQLTYGAVLFAGEPLTFGLIGKAIIFVGIPAAVGVLVGSLPFYMGAYYLGKPFIDKFGKILGIRWEDIEKLDKKFHRNHWDDIVFTGLRATPLLPSVLLAVGAGVLRLPVRTYVLGTLLGTFIRASVMGSVGAIIGTRLDSLAETIDRMGTIGSVILAVSIGIFVIGYLVRKKHWFKKSHWFKK